MYRTVACLFLACALASAVDVPGSDAEAAVKKSGTPIPETKPVAVQPETTNLKPETRPWPLWDGHESIEHYARRANLPPTKTLDLGGGVTLDLVLIPAGSFIMGTPEPKPVDEDGFRKKIVIGRAVFAVGVAVLLALVATVIIRAIRQRQGHSIPSRGSS